MLQTWRKFLSLNHSLKPFAIRAALALLIVRLGLYLLGFRKMQRAILPPAPADGNPLQENRLASARSIARLQTAVARRLFSHPNCLENSLALCWQLRGEGIPARLKLGGHQDTAGFTAHAWVECAGVVLTDTNGEYRDYIPFAAPIGEAESRRH